MGDNKKICSRVIAINILADVMPKTAGGKRRQADVLEEGKFTTG